MKRAILAIACLTALSACTSKGPTRLYEPLVVSAEEKEVAQLDAPTTTPAASARVTEHDTQFSGD